jgi:hypothetical protein
MPVRRPLIGICHRPNRARYLRRTPVCPYLSNGLSVHWGATEKVACFAPTPSGSNDVSIILQIPSNGSAWSLPFHSSHMGRVKSKCLWRSRWVARQSHDRLKLMPFRSSSIEKGIFAVPISTMYSPSPGSVTGAENLYRQEARSKSRSPCLGVSRLNCPTDRSPTPTALPLRLMITGLPCRTVPACMTATWSRACCCTRW